MNKEDQIEVAIKYKDFKQTISGSPENVTREYFTALSKVLPALKAISSLSFQPTLPEMAVKLSKSAQIFKDRIFIIEKRLSTENSVLLILSVKYFGFGLKLTSNDVMSFQEIIDVTGKSKKAISKVMEKLTSANAIEQTLDGKYRIFDWKAYDFALKKGNKQSSIKLTDFVEGSQLPIFSIGYEGQEASQFIKLLKNEKVDILLDVRKDAYSKQDTSYSEGTLCHLLANSAIKYIHVPELGVDYNLREELRSTGDYETYFKRYSEYLDKNGNLVDFIAKLARTNVICLMCYEKDFKRCHRSILASKLENLGLTFHHL